MCSMCQATEEGICFCGTSMDPQGRTEPCGAKSDAAYCTVCGHSAAYEPLDTAHLGSEYSEY